MRIQDSIRKLYKTYPPKWIIGFLEFCALLYCIPSPPQYLTTPKYMISNWPISETHWQSSIISFCTGRSKNTLLYIYSLPEQILSKEFPTLIQHHPPLASMDVCKQKFRIMRYFSILPLLTYWHGGHIFHSIHYDILKLVINNKCTILQSLYSFYLL